MKEELISVSVDELKEAEQEMTQFLAESYLDYLSACEDTLSRKYKITKSDKKELYDKVQKDGRTLEEIKKETFDNLVKRIHFSTEQICEYIEEPESFKEMFGLFSERPYEKYMEEEAEKEAFLGLLTSSMRRSPEHWEKHFSKLPKKKDTTTYTAEELLEAEESLLNVIQENFINASLEHFNELMEVHKPDEATLSVLEKYADDAFLEGIDMDEFEDRVDELTFDDLKMAKIKVSVSDVLNYIKDPEAVEKNFYSFITKDYMEEYIRKQYIITFFSDMYEDDLNDTEE